MKKMPSADPSARIDEGILTDSLLATTLQIRTYKDDDGETMMPADYMAIPLSIAGAGVSQVRIIERTATGTTGSLPDCFFNNSLG